MCEVRDGIVKHYERLLITACDRVRDRTIAEDMVQTTCLKALKHAHQFKPGTNILQWLSRILDNAVIDFYRGNTCMREAEGRFAVHLVAFTEPRDAATLAQQVIDLKRELEHLPQQVQTLLAMNALRGPQTTAENFGIRIGRVRQRLWEVREKLALAIYDEA